LIVDKGQGRALCAHTAQVLPAHVFRRPAGRVNRPYCHLQRSQGLVKNLTKNFLLKLLSCRGHALRVRKHPSLTSFLPPSPQKRAWVRCDRGGGRPQESPLHSVLVLPLPLTPLFTLHSPHSTLHSPTGYNPAQPRGQSLIV